MPTAEEVAYHRSYLSPYYKADFQKPNDGMPDRRTHESIETTHRYQGLQRKPTKADPSTLASAFVAFAVPKPGVRLRALLDQDSAGLIDIQMQVKKDQEFDEYATPWEWVWSSLVSIGPGPFMPIVDRAYRVVGHQGELRNSAVPDPTGAGLYVPAAYAGITDLKTAMKKGVVVFVHSPTTAPAGWVALDMFNGEQRVVVRTTIDGEVVDFGIMNVGYLSSPWYSPSDLYALAKVFAGLVKFGVVATVSLSAKATAKLEGRAMMKGPTAALARESEAAATRNGFIAPARAATVSDLRSANRARGMSRQISPTEMETYLRNVLSKRPYLARIGVAQRMDGEALATELRSIIDEMCRTTGREFRVVSEGTVQKLGSQGAGGWAVNAAGKEVLIIEKQAFDKPRELLREVRHELASDAVREMGKGGPFLTGELSHVSASNFWLEMVIETGDKTWGLLRQRVR